jgi:cytochrome d ubiquinol oxidase subunit I
VGVVTGIVQEFQFGMNWSAYSRFVGDIFGAPLAMEGLLAFFAESTFLGLWIFGWGRLSPRVHLATIWLAAIGSNLSAYFILAANSWMQHPVGYRINPVTHRAQLTSIWKVLTNSTVLAAVPHVFFAGFVTAGIFFKWWRPVPGTWPGGTTPRCSAVPSGSAWWSPWWRASPPRSPGTCRPA